MHISHVRWHHTLGMQRLHEKNTEIYTYVGCIAFRSYRGFLKRPLWVNGHAIVAF